MFSVSFQLFSLLIKKEHQLCAPEFAFRLWLFRIEVIDVYVITNYDVTAHIEAYTETSSHQMT